MFLFLSGLYIGGRYGVFVKVSVRGGERCEELRKGSRYLLEKGGGGFLEEMVL